jgi:hypothetical protein
LTGWAVTLVPVCSAIVGALIALTGQALADRRTTRREREARRENFKIQNFEIHRNALLEAQQVLDEFSRKTIDEKLRRESGEYAYFDANPLKKAGHRL